MSKLETEKISKTYRGRRVVDDVSVFVQQAKWWAARPQRRGQDTSFYMIVGLISPDSGRILVDDKDITGLPMYQRARRGISYLPQEASVFRKLTVEENLMRFWRRCRCVPASAAKPWSDCWTSWPGNRAPQPRLHAQWRRAAARGNRPLTGHQSELSAVGRAVQRIDPIQVLELQRIIFDLKRTGIGILVTDHNVTRRWRSPTAPTSSTKAYLSRGKSGSAGARPRSAAGVLRESFTLRV